MTYSNILELYFDQDQEREERRERYEREHPEEAAIIPSHKPWTPEVRAVMEAAVEKICADICAERAWPFKEEAQTVCVEAV